MLCQDCHKNEATIPFTQIVDGKKTVHHLCASCAEKRSGGSESVTVTLSSFLAEDGDEEEEAEGPDLTCASCGLTYVEFKKTGRFGCDRCYAAFGSELDDVFKRLHGADRHAEEAAPPAVVEDSGEDLEGLRQALKEAVTQEHFEEAARLRDRIAAVQARGAGVKT
jgi:protein arginine kinase activator